MGEGMYKDGLMHGNGVYHYADQSRFQGQYCANLRSGYGVFTFADGSLYEGEWRDDRPHGAGCVIYPGGEIVKATFTNGEQDIGESIAERSALDMGASVKQQLKNVTMPAKVLTLHYGAATSPTQPALPCPFAQISNDEALESASDQDSAVAKIDTHQLALQK